MTGGAQNAGAPVVAPDGGSPSPAVARRAAPPAFLHRGRSGPAILAAIALFLLVVGGKALVIDHYGSDLATWDQWDAEGRTLFLPYLEGRLSWRDFFTPHNEHRIACTKALALLLLMANGQWDCDLECLANAVLHGSLAAAFFLFGARRLPPGRSVVWLAVLAGLVATPISWQNIVGGFHSQQIFLLGFSVLAIALLLYHRAPTIGWWAGMLSATVALFTMGSGLLAPAAIIVVLAASAPPREVLSKHLPTLALCAMLVAIGWLLRVPVPQHGELAAHSTRDFALTFWQNLQWPVVTARWYPLLGWLPWAWFAWRLASQRRLPDAWDRVTVAVGLWTLLQFLAAAYARGNEAPWPASRYLDTVAVGIACNVLIALRAFNEPAGSGARTALRWVGAIGGFAMLIIALGRHVHHVSTVDLPFVGESMLEREDSTRAYLATGDPRELEGRDLAFPNADVLIERLSHSEIRAILPASVRPPLTLKGEALPVGTFAPGAVPPEATVAAPAWYVGSFTEAGAATKGEWRSPPIPPGHAKYWRFDLAGDSRSPQIKAELRVAATDALGQALQFSVTPRRPSQASAVIRAPRQPVVLVARDSSTAAGMAVAGPIETAAGSVFAAALLRHASVLLLIGTLLATGAFLPLPLGRRAPSATIP